MSYIFCKLFFSGCLTSHSPMSQHSPLPHFKAPQNWLLLCNPTHHWRVFPRLFDFSWATVQTSLTKKGRIEIDATSLQFLLLCSLTVCCQSNLSSASRSSIDFHFSTTEKECITILPGPLSMLCSDIQPCLHSIIRREAPNSFRPLFRCLALCEYFYFCIIFCLPFKLLLTYNIAFVSDEGQWLDIYVTSEMITPVSAVPTTHS